MLIVVGMSLGMAFTTPGLIHAQNSGSNVDRGRTLARAWCAECYRVEEGRERSVQERAALMSCGDGRVTFWGALAMALTAGIGKVFGTVV